MTAWNFQLNHILHGSPAFQHGHIPLLLYPTIFLTIACTQIGSIISIIQALGSWSQMTSELILLINLGTILLGLSAQLCSDHRTRFDIKFPQQFCNGVTPQVSITLQKCKAAYASRVYLETDWPHVFICYDTYQCFPVKIISHAQFTKCFKATCTGAIARSMLISIQSHALPLENLRFERLYSNPVKVINYKYPYGKRQ